jgi:hypothetical protein
MVPKQQGWGGKDEVKVSVFGRIGIMLVWYLKGKKYDNDFPSAAFSDS